MTLVIANLIDSVRARGASLIPLGERLRVIHPERLDAATIDELRREKYAVMRALEAEHAAVAIVGVQHLLREGRWLATPPVCHFLVGHASEACRRCGASWLEHYPSFPN